MCYHASVMPDNVKSAASCQALYFIILRQGTSLGVTALSSMHSGPAHSEDCVHKYLAHLSVADTLLHICSGVWLRI